MTPNMTGSSLTQLSTLAGWATPTTRDYKDGACDLSKVPINSLLGRQALLTVFGETLHGYIAAMNDGDRLNPRHSLWLMALPAEWASCGERAMLSTPNSRRRS